MYYLIVAAIIKDELDLPEWAAHHIGLGVEHFLKYDNGETLKVRDQLARFVARGLVTIVQVTGKSMQMSVYEDALRRGRDGPLKTRWIAFIDADEFILPMREDDLRPFLRARREAGFAMSWALFGSAGHIHRPEGLIVNNYRLRCGRLWEEVKCIVDPARTVRALTAHSFAHLEGEVTVNEHGARCRGALNPPSGDFIRINHYALKSQHDIRLKLARGCSDGPNVRTAAMMAAHDAVSNQVTDETILRFVPRIMELLPDGHLREACVHGGE